MTTRSENEPLFVMDGMAYYNSAVEETYKDKTSEEKEEELDNRLLDKTIGDLYQNNLPRLLKNYDVFNEVDIHNIITKEVENGSLDWFSSNDEVNTIFEKHKSLVDKLDFYFETTNEIRGNLIRLVSTGFVNETSSHEEVSLHLSKVDGSMETLKESLLATVKKLYNTYVKYKTIKNVELVKNILIESGLTDSSTFEQIHDVVETGFDKVASNLYARISDKQEYVAKNPITITEQIRKQVVNGFLNNDSPSEKVEFILGNETLKDRGFININDIKEEADIKEENEFFYTHYYVGYNEYVKYIAEMYNWKYVKSFVESKNKEPYLLFKPSDNTYTITYMNKDVVFLAPNTLFEEETNVIKLLSKTL